MADAGNLLVRAGLLDPEALAAAREAKASVGGTIAEHLVLGGAIADDELTQFFRERLLVPRVAEDRLHDLPTRIISKVPRDMAAELRVIPVSLDRESSLTVAMSDPSDTHALDELEFFTEHYVVRAVASQRQIAWCLARYYDVVTPLYEETSNEGPQKGSDRKFENAVTEPFGGDGAASRERRPGRITSAVAASRRKVLAPATLPPLPDEATLADLDDGRGRVAVSRLARSNEEYEQLDENDLVELISEPDLITGAGDADELGFVAAIERMASAHDNHVELELDDDDDETYDRPATLADGSPAELAPRAGEMLVNSGRSRDVSTAPAVVLDDSLFDLDRAEPAVSLEQQDRVEPEEPEEPEEEEREEPEERAQEQPQPEQAGDDEAEVIEVLTDSDLEEMTPEALAEEVGEEPGGEVGEEVSDDTTIKVAAAGWIDEVVTEEMVERGTDSAPFLLSEIKEAAERADRERATRRATRRSAAPTKRKALIETEAVKVEEIEDTDAIVLLDQPKRLNRRTSRGHGAPSRRVAAALGLRTGRETDVDALAGQRTAEASDEPTQIESAPAVIDRDDSQELALRDDDTTEVVAAPEVPEFRAPTNQPELDSDDATRLLDTLEALGASTKRDQIVAALVDYLDHYCERVVFLAVRAAALEPWLIRGSGSSGAPTDASLPLRELSLFRDVVDTRLTYRGPVTDAQSRGLLESVFGGVEHEGLAMPVAVRGRVVGVLYGEGLSDALSNDNIAVVTQAVGRALERAIKRSPRMTP